MAQIIAVRDRRMPTDTRSERKPAPGAFESFCAHVHVLLLGDFRVNVV